MSELEIQSIYVTVSAGLGATDNVTANYVSIRFPGHVYTITAAECATSISENGFRNRWEFPFS